MFRNTKTISDRPLSRREEINWRNAVTSTTPLHGTTSFIAEAMPDWVVDDPHFRLLSVKQETAFPSLASINKYDF